MLLSWLSRYAIASEEDGPSTVKETSCQGRPHPPDDRETSKVTLLPGVTVVGDSTETNGTTGLFGPEITTTFFAFPRLPRQLSKGGLSHSAKIELAFKVTDELIGGNTVT